jgi:hypothetical protein
VLALDACSTAQDHRAFDDVLQLSYVSRPGGDELESPRPSRPLATDSGCRIQAPRSNPRSTLQDVSLWAEVNVFVDAKRGGWLDAVRYFSSMSLRSMKAWSHWEDVNHRWRRTMPEEFPSLEQWRRQIDAVRRLSNPDSRAQQVLESIWRTSEPEWCRLRSLLFGSDGILSVVGAHPQSRGSELRNSVHRVRPSVQRI